MASLRVLDTLFYPKSVSIVGASANPSGWGGSNFLTDLLKRGYQGNVYPVNPKATVISGLKCYPDVKSLPEIPDLVIIAIPAPGVPQVLRDCVTRGVKNVHIFSSGFSETGEEEGRKLDAEITDIISNSDLRVVGPNCMGIWVPGSKLTYWGDEPKGIGSLALISQSGGHGEFLTLYAQQLGIYFSKVISFGNARGLQASDFLEYFAADPETKMIACYFEGMKQGGKVTKMIASINRAKPVFVWKSGLTPSGARAVSSHTGSLAGEEKIWKAFYAQTGAVPVNSLEEIADMALAFQHLKHAGGRRVLLLGGGGGNSVALADICSREGLDVPRLTENTRLELNKFIRLAGNSVRNPVDAWSAQDTPDLFHKTLELTVNDPNIDAVIIDRLVWHTPDDRLKFDQVNDYLIDFVKHNHSQKPIVISLSGVNSSLASVTTKTELLQKFTRAGIAAYASTINAARALSKFIAYHEFLAR
ncbi:MAG: CoA-binding protein [Dehalococcoidales bacterium]|nr:CoA-binding protein [Dehalococcoidales bacterium]